MPTVIDDVVSQTINSTTAIEAQAGAATRTRSWDTLGLAAGAAQVVSLGSPTVMAGQGIRMLSGTPTAAPPGPVNP